MTDNEIIVESSVNGDIWFWLKVIWKGTFEPAAWITSKGMQE
jgi:hypothetical protein